MAVMDILFRVKKSMPEGIMPLFFIQIFSTLSFSVLYSTLVLYMKGSLGLPVTMANSIMGIFIAFNFALHLLGGFWGGRLLSNPALFCMGMLAQVIGCILLSVNSLTFLYYGLAVFLTGSGLNVTCLNCMLTQRFAPQDNRRETAFLWNYAGMNIGFFIGFTLSGVFQISQNYQRLFLLSSLGNLIALLICLYSWQQLKDNNTLFSQKNRLQKRNARITGIGCIVLLPFVLCPMLQYSAWANRMVLIVGIIMLGLILVMAQKQRSIVARNKIKAFAAFIIVGTVFWMLYQIGPMGLTVFVDHNVQRNYAGMIIPPQWFQNINTISVVLGGPLLAFLFKKMRSNGHQINIPTQFATALMLIGCAFVILPIGIKYASSTGMVNPGWIVASYVLQSAGELLISPIGYAMIGFLAPPSLQGLMMGMWMLSNGVGATLSGYSSNMMIHGENNVSPLLTNIGYSQVFLILGLFAIASAIALFLFIPKLKNLIQENKCVSDDSDSELLASKRVVV